MRLLVSLLFITLQIFCFNGFLFTNDLLWYLQLIFMLKVDFYKFTRHVCNVAILPLLIDFRKIRPAPYGITSIVGIFGPAIIKLKVN